ncbi:uncharacterized protein LOC135681434 [Rhopilema esculentum]|uniref:uncharacterized protein LOC135681434 n=1 Tax=Rhopilema esculentum TaxID=499914 RepID=UPI0031D87F1A|eukprot:gene13443-4314_t
MSLSDVNLNIGSPKGNPAEAPLPKPGTPANGTRNNDSMAQVTPRFKTNNRRCGNKLLVSLPILNVALSLIFVVASYAYAYSKKGLSFLDSNHDVAFISDLGNKTPESSLFTFGMILSSCCSFGVVLVRYFQVKHSYVRLDNRFNKATLAAGSLFVFGKVMVSSFQNSSVKAVHFAGAGIYIIFACIYAAMQTLITLKNKVMYGKVKHLLCLSRPFLTAGMIVGTLILLIFLHPDLLKYNEKGKSVGQGGEWFFACCKMLFMLTFVADFWYLHPRLLLNKPNEQIINDLVLSNIGSQREANESSKTSNHKDIERSQNGIASFVVGDEGLVVENNAALATGDQKNSKNGQNVVHFSIEEE